MKEDNSQNNGMTDLGHTMDEDTCCAEPMSKSEMKNKKYYPHLYLDTDELPELQGCKVGEEVELHFIAKITSMSINDHGNGKQAHYDFDLLQGEVEASAPEEDDADMMMKSKPKKMPMYEDNTDGE